MDQETRQQLRSSGEFSDLTVEVGSRKFSLHKFPMLGCSEYFRGLVKSGMSDSYSVKLNKLPGGEAAMELIADFCYGLPILLTLENISDVMCASIYLQVENLTTMCKSELNQLLEESRSNCFAMLSHCIDTKRSAELEAAGVTNMCTNAIVEHLKCSIPGSNPGTMIGKMSRSIPLGSAISLDTSTTGTMIRRSMPLGSAIPSTTWRKSAWLETETIAGWVDDMSRFPVKWIAYIMEKLSDAHREWDELPTKLTDHFLNHTATHGSMSGKEFILLLRASLSAPRKSYDLVFEALEKMMVAKTDCQTSPVTSEEICQPTLVAGSASDSSDRLSDSDIRNILECIDFSRLSQEALERAAQNKRIPHELMMKKVLSACSQLRTQLPSCKCATIMQQISGRWSSDNELLEVSHQSTGFDRSELRLRRKSKNGTWTQMSQSVKEQETYLAMSMLTRENRLQVNKQQTAAAFILPVFADPRLLIISTGDELLTLRHPNRDNFIRWRKHTGTD